jgi:hypothetical protein
MTTPDVCQARRSGFAVRKSGGRIQDISESPSFQYDIYGRQIGKTDPNANLSSCK